MTHVRIVFSPARDTFLKPSQIVHTCPMLDPTHFSTNSIIA
jgi:hypothetical protein